MLELIQCPLTTKCIKQIMQENVLKVKITFL